MVFECVLCAKFISKLLTSIHIFNFYDSFMKQITCSNKMQAEGSDFEGDCVAITPFGCLAHSFSAHF